MSRRDGKRNNKRKDNVERIKINKKIIIILIIVFMVLISVIFSLLNSTNNKIIKGIKIEGIDVSNLSKDEAIEKISKWYNDIVLKDIELEYEDTIQTINAQELEVKNDINKKIDEAYKIGRDSNILINNYKILFTNILGKNINLNISLNEEKLDKKVEEISNKLPNTVIQTNYYVEDENLIIKMGRAGITIDSNTKERIKNVLKQENKEITLDVIEVQNEQLDVEKMYYEISKESQNAYITENPTKIHTHINGIKISKSIDEIKELLNSNEEEYIIPLIILEPEIKISNLKINAFPDKLTEFSTRYELDNVNRVNNLELASNKINGTIVMPGEVFSYNKVVGERTISKGFKEATIYSGGKVVQGIGGGICQLSSMLYNVALTANLEIVSRSNHRFMTSYVQAGKDATVSWGTIDFCFKNTRSYPIKIISNISNGIAKVELYGIKEEKEYEVVVETYILEEVPFKTTYIDDYTIEEGNQVITQVGMNGIKSITYKTIKYNGVTISNEVLSNDTYSTLEQIVRVGKK